MTPGARPSSRSSTTSPRAPRSSRAASRSRRTWTFFAIDEIGDLALSFHLDSHPVAVARLTRFLVQHDVPFVLHEAFTIDDDDQIVFESDTGADFDEKK